VRVRQCAFAATIDCNVRNSNDKSELANLTLYAPEACPTDDARNDRTLEEVQVSVYTITLQRLNREYRRDSVAERTSLLLSDSQFCTHINSTRSYPLHLIKMRFVRQPLTIRFINCDDRLRKMGDNAEKRKHGAMLPSTIRAIICGTSNCGKTNVLISLLESPHVVRFENVYVYSKSLQQPKYQYLENLLSSIDDIDYFTFSNNSDVVPRSDARPNSIFIFDDVACDKQDTVREFLERISRWADTRTSTVFISANHTREYLNILYETTRIC